MITFDDAISQSPIIAILRGLVPNRAIQTVQVLYDAGLRVVEVPLNSPEPFQSIELIANEFGSRMIVGAGTVTDAKSVDKVHSAGGRIIVAPNLNLAVGARAKANAMIWAPGVLTPTEAFAALDAEADIFKIFPADIASPVGIKALKAVLPAHASVAAVGGVTPENLRDFREAGASTFGIGSAIFKPSDSLDEIREKAFAFQRAALS